MCKCCFPVNLRALTIWDSDIKSWFSMWQKSKRQITGRSTMATGYITIRTKQIFVPILEITNNTTQLPTKYIMFLPYQWTTRLVTYLPTLNLTICEVSPPPLHGHSYTMLVALHIHFSTNYVPIIHYFCYCR